MKILILTLIILFLILIVVGLLQMGAQVYQAVRATVLYLWEVLTKGVKLLLKGLKITLQAVAVVSGGTVILLIVGVIIIVAFLHLLLREAVRKIKKKVQRWWRQR
jgi:hypothetical protein